MELDLGGRAIAESAVAFAVTAFEQRAYRHDYSSSSPTPTVRSAFAGFRFPPDIIVLAVRWYLRHDLSYRDTEELLAERGTRVNHTHVGARIAAKPLPSSLTLRWLGPCLPPALAYPPVTAQTRP